MMRGFGAADGASGRIALIVAGNRSRWRGFASALIAAVFVAGCRGNATQYRADSTGSNRYQDSAITAANAANLAPGWRFAPSDHPCYAPGETRPWGILATPVVYKDDVLVAGNNGCFYDLDRASGSPKYSRDFGFQPGYDNHPAAPPDQPFMYNYDCPAQGFMASPALVDEVTVANGALVTTPYVYVHAPDGTLHKLQFSDGSDVWSVAVDPPINPDVNDYFPWSSPFPMPSLGPTHTVTTADGTTLTLPDGIVYIGLSSTCDEHFAPGGVRAIDMYTGQVLWSWYSEPSDPAAGLYDVGGGVWPGLASDGQSLFAATGSVTGCLPDGTPSDPYLHNPYKFDPVTGAPIANSVDPTSDNVLDACNPPGNQYSLVELNALTGALQCAFRIPAADTTIGDADFSSGVTVWNANINGTSTELFGATDKNGFFYALNAQDCSLVWKNQIGDPTPDGGQAADSGAVYDKTTAQLFLAGNHITSDPDNKPGSGDEIVIGRVRSVDPATGTTIWEQTLPANPLGAGTLNPNGLLAYAGMDWNNGSGNGVYLLDTTQQGKIVAVLKDNAFAQTSCATYNSTDATTRCTWPQFAQPVPAQAGYWMTNLAAITPFTLATSTTSARSTTTGAVSTHRR
jgi:hypothetical protein